MQSTEKPRSSLDALGRCVLVHASRVEGNDVASPIGHGGNGGIDGRDVLTSLELGHLGEGQRGGGKGNDGGDGELHFDD